MTTLAGLGPMDPLWTLIAVLTFLLLAMSVISYLDPYLSQHPQEVLMAQDDQMIGNASTRVDAIAAQHKGWITGPFSLPGTDTDHTPQESLGDQITDAGDYSAWDRRANKQTMFRDVPHMAGHVEPSMAVLDPTPTAGAETDGN